MKRNYNIDTADFNFEALASDMRRNTLSALSEENSMTVDELSKALGGSSENEIERNRIQIYHNHLPKLVDLGLVEKKEGDITIYEISHLFKQSPVFSHLDSFDLDYADEFFEGLSNEDRRLILSYLHDAGEPVSRERLVEYIHENTEDFNERSESGVLVETLHTTIPKLDYLDLIDYSEEQYVVYPGDKMKDKEVDRFLDSLYRDI